MDEPKPLSELLDIKHGFAFDGKYFQSEPTEYLLLTPGNFHRDQHLYFGSNTKYYSGPIPRDFVLENGDLLVVMTDLTKEMVILGNAVILEAACKVLHNQRIGKVTLKDDSSYDKRYVCYLLGSPLVRKHVKVTASGTTVRHTSPKKILSAKVTVPVLPVQTRIADILDTWEQSISVLRCLIDSSQGQKRVLMQQLLTGRRRLPGFDAPWQEKRVGELLQEVAREVDWDDEATYNLLSVRRRSGGLFLRESLMGSEILTKKMKVAREGDFLISKMQVLHGATALVTDPFDGMHISGSYISLRSRSEDELDIRFFNWLSRTKRFYHQTYLCSYGVHIEKMTFSLKLFLKEKVLLPSDAKEQAAIVNVLQCAENQIAQYGAQLNRLKQEKKALKQQLLTGKLRVKVGKEAA